MSKPRRPKYQRPAVKPAATSVDGTAPSAEPTPNLDEVAPEFAQPEPAFFEASAQILPAPFEGPAARPFLAAPSPRLLSAESFGTTVMNYVIGEGEAFAAHMRALAGARSMADFVRLQIEEFQRAADSTLTCWGMLAMSASRTVRAR